MYKSKRELGNIGEDIACKYLIENNYVILDRNFISRQGEIDIVAIDKDELVFIEVKTRTNSAYGKPADAVTDVKQNHLIRAIQYYLHKKHFEDSFVRIDIIEVYIVKDKLPIVNHIKQVY